MTKALHELTDTELADLEREYPRGDHPIYRTDLGAEVARRRAIQTERRALTAIIIAAISATASAVAAIASWYTIYLSQHPSLCCW